MAMDIRGMAPLRIRHADLDQVLLRGAGFEIVATDGKTAPHFEWVLLRLNGA